MKDMMTYKEAIKLLRETNDFLADLIEDSILILSHAYERDLSNDEKMIAYSCFLTGTQLPKVAPDVFGANSEPIVYSLN